MDDYTADDGDLRRQSINLVKQAVRSAERTAELHVVIRMARRNGVTLEELEEVTGMDRAAITGIAEAESS